MKAAQASTEELLDLYRELIIDHAKSPRHYGRIDNATHQAAGVNPLCGDKLELYLRINPDGQIDEVTFEGSGCAISVASASLLTESVTGLKKNEATSRFESVVNALTASRLPSHADIGKLAALLGVREFPSRVKCATLSWHALNAAINGASEPATTE